PISISRIFEEDAGIFYAHRILQAETIKVRSRFGSANLSVPGRPAPAPAATKAQKSFSKAVSPITDALEHFSRADNWHDLYKSFEALGDKAGLLSMGFSRTEIRDFTLTAQITRHHKATS